MIVNNMNTDYSYKPHFNALLVKDSAMKAIVKAGKERVFENARPRLEKMAKFIDITVGLAGQKELVDGQKASDQFIKIVASPMNLNGRDNLFNRLDSALIGLIGKAVNKSKLDDMKSPEDFTNLALFARENLNTSLTARKATLQKVG